VRFGIVLFCEGPSCNASFADHRTISHTYHSSMIRSLQTPPDAVTLPASRASCVFSRQQLRWGVLTTSSSGHGRSGEKMQGKERTRRTLRVPQSTRVSSSSKARLQNLPSKGQDSSVQGNQTEGKNRRDRAESIQPAGRHSEATRLRGFANNALATVRPVECEIGYAGPRAECLFHPHFLFG
jgi:hypothetical protein